jgi:hypothetical protein
MKFKNVRVGHSKRKTALKVASLFSGNLGDLENPNFSENPQGLSFSFFSRPKGYL